MRIAPRAAFALFSAACLSVAACSSGSGTDPVADCDGTPGGAAYVDDCGACVGGRTGRTACAPDCAGVLGGRAAVDQCGACTGGTTGKAPCAQDCAGEWGGAATIDHCGQCVGGTTGATACLQDCAGTWGGRAAVDHCGACAGGTTGRMACAQDCAGVWDGTATTDHCGQCVGGTTGQVACAQDCAGTWGGRAALDRCGACVGGTTGRTACAQDCAGVWGGQAAVDRCGVCAGGTTAVAACTQDCAVAWGGQASRDACGRCVGGTTGQTECTQDCAGVWGGVAALDRCGVCAGGSTGRAACGQDCAGVWGGGATTDRCGACVGGTTGQVACVQDCSGVWGGGAQRDGCNRCAGGTTGRLACESGVCRVGAGETVQKLVDNPACAVVEVPAGTYNGPIEVDLARMGGKQTVEVRGLSRDATVFTGGTVRTFVVAPGATLRLSDVTIRGNGSIDGLQGSAVHNSGTANLARVVITGNKSHYAGVVVNAGAMEISASEISGNLSRDFTTVLGGAIYNTGALHVTGTSIIGNSALTRGDGFGGAICNDGGGALLIEDSELGANAVSSDLNTTGTLDGAGIFNYFGTVDVRRTSIHHNQAVNAGNDAHGGGISSWGGTVTLSADSDVSFNEITANASVAGGGIFLGQHAELQMDGATIQGNVVRAPVSAAGAALAAAQSSLVLAGALVANNRLELQPGSSGWLSGSVSGGIINVSEGALVMRGGKILENAVAGSSPLQGGLIRVSAASSSGIEAIDLDGVEIAGNDVSGDGLRGGIIWAPRILRLTGCDIHANTVHAGRSGMNGGLVYDWQGMASAAPGEVTVAGTRIEGNVVTDDDYGVRGGLLYVALDRAAPILPSISTSIIAGNTVTSPGWIAGGLFAFDEPRHVRISDCAVSDNVVDSSGGAWVHTSSTISGGIFYHAYSGWQDPDDDGDVELLRCDVSRNRVGSVTDSESVRGGIVGLYVPFHLDGRQLTYAVTNVTLSQNVVRAHAPVDGGLVTVSNENGAAVRIVASNATVALNQVDGALGTIYDIEQGWVVKDLTKYRPVSVLLHDTVVAQNTAARGDCLLSGLLTTTASLGYNLLGDVASCDGLTAAATDLVGADPLFGAYGAGGGALPSLPLLPGSPAIDGGDPAGCADAAGAVLSTDQRGLPRPQGARCDIGAYEVQGP